jgi:hypothetical protein
MSDTKKEKDLEEEKVTKKENNDNVTEIKKDIKEKDEKNEENNEIEKKREDDEDEYADLIFGELNIKGDSKKRKRDESLEEAVDELRSKDIKRPRIMKTPSEVKYDEDALKRDEHIIEKKAKMSQRQIIEVFS